MQNTQTIRLMIIDDDAMLLAGLKRILRPYFSIQTATSGADAIIQVRCASNPFSVVVCNMLMPGLNGAETLSEIYRLSPNTVQIMLSGEISASQFFNNFPENCIFRFLEKPISEGAIVMSILQAFNENKIYESEGKILKKIIADIIDR